MPEPLLARTPRELRAEVEQLMRDDLIGPRGGPEEELRDPPIDVYLLGLLAPQFNLTSATGRAEQEDEEQLDLLLPEEELAEGGITADSAEEGTVEDRPPAVDQLVPSALGLTVALDDDCAELEIEASWGAYSRVISAERMEADKPARVWRRRECGGTQTITVGGPGPIEALTPDPDEPAVIVRGLVRQRGSQRLVSLFLVNGQTADGGRAAPMWLCQARLSVRHPEGRAVFVRRPIDAIELAPDVDRQELSSLEMQYRATVELAVGHGTGVQATESPDQPGRGVVVETAAMPAQEVPRTDTPGPGDFGEEAIRAPFAHALSALDMKTLSEAGDADLPSLLTPLVDAYEAWIESQQQRLDEPDLLAYRQPAQQNIAGAHTAAQRMRAGIATLADPDAAEAFRFANHAMWQQRVHTTAADARRRDPALKLHEAVTAADVAANRSWRAFQLAFVLVNLPSLADPTHPERGEDALLDLLFFPAGGGKTEAYLGLTAFAIAIRRLQGVVAGRDGRDGVAVLMRYTLRLLTLQQFQRAAALLCACELRRRALHGDGRTEEQRRWGATPMRIGLWVGEASTPNRTADASQWVKAARERRGFARGPSPLQLARCPWCGSPLEAGRDVEVDTICERTILSCPDATGQCPFTPRNSDQDGLPVIVVDSEVYRLLPALVIATVDKLARMPWEGRTQALFGQVSRRCERHGYLTPEEDEHPSSHPRRGRLLAASVLPCSPLRPPDLIIQDELHLISGPLGSLVGLYETAVDELCSWPVDGQRVRPKLIASTATIRRARDQVARLFHRDLAVFPPPGLDARDSFFALQRDDESDRQSKPGRLYLGVCAPGRRYKQVLIRVYVAQLRAAWEVLRRQPGDDADAYMTLVGYFNSLRELGGMRRLVEDDVQSRLFRVDGESRGRLVLEELTSRKSASEIPRTLDQLGVPRTSRERPKGKESGASEPRSIDVLLATNMISVGVDVPRLGTMVVAGQPKTTSEYIQATSRVGRDRPGIVIAVYNWARPRDLSHYETFCHYHRSLYRQVEAMSVTPFAPRALDRGLTGVLVSLLRLSGPDWDANADAANVDPADPRAQWARETIRARAGDQISHTAAEDLAEAVTKRLESWKAEADIGQRRLVYRRRGKSDADVSLLHAPGIESWDEWTVPTSMRNVEAAVPLRLRRDIAPATADWEPPERSAPPHYPGEESP